MRAQDFTQASHKPILNNNLSSQEAFKPILTAHAFFTTSVGVTPVAPYVLRIYYWPSDVARLPDFWSKTLNGQKKMISPREEIFEFFPVFCLQMADNRPSKICTIE